MRLITHYSVDLDAVASIWAARRFMPGGDKAKLTLVPANWDGSDIQEGDIVVDVDAGGKGLKGNIDHMDGTRYSAFRMIMGAYAPQTDQKALSGLIDYVDLQDSRGSAVRAFVPDNKQAQRVLGSGSLNAVLHGFKATITDEEAIVFRMNEIFDGLHKSGLQRELARMEADKVQRFHGGKIALVNQTPASNPGVNGILFGEMGVLMVIYQDGYNIGIVAAHDCVDRADHDVFRKVIHKAGETNEWFAHPSGFLFCRGSKKAKAVSPSKVQVRDLITEAALMGPDWPAREDERKDQ